MGTTGQRPSKVDEIGPKNTPKQPNVFLRLITKMHQLCLRVENKR